MTDLKPGAIVVADVDSVDVKLPRELAELKLNGPELGSDADVAFTVEVLLMVVCGVKVEMLRELAELKLDVSDIGTLLSQTWTA